MITAHAYARAGLVGNPSDGYFGKTISFIIRDFSATVTLTESDKFVIKPHTSDTCEFDNVHAMMRDVKLMGYYGAMRVLKAAVVKFHQYFEKGGRPLQGKNFTLEFSSTIPRLVGMSGSSAIIVAAFRAMMKHYNVHISKTIMPTFVLATEKEELNITAGLQDRVIQTYEGIVYMDFEKSYVHEHGHGKYEELTPNPMPPLYVAYDPQRAEISDVTHRNLKALYEAGDSTVVNAMQKYRDLTDHGKSALMSGDWGRLHEVTNENFELRKTIMPIAPENQRMIDVARSVGASAKFAGSGGAICGVFHGEDQFNNLSAALAGIGCTTIKPTIFP
jgi:glucuronokinase